MLSAGSLKKYYESSIHVITLQMLFPLLSKLLENFNPQDPNGIEETRMRASTLLCKVGTFKFIYLNFLNGTKLGMR